MFRRPGYFLLFVAAGVTLLLTFRGFARATGLQDTARRIFLQGEDALRTGRYAVAEQDFRRVTAIDPQSAAAYSNLGVVYTHFNRLEAAIGAFETARHLAPNLPGIDLNLAIAYYNEKRFRKAIPHFQRVLARDSLNVQARYLSGISYFLLGECRPALDALAPIMSQEKSDLDYLFVLGACYAKMNRASNSKSVLLQLVKAGGNSPHLHLLLAQAYLGLQENALARQEIESALVGDGRLPLAHYDLGLVDQRLGRLNRAAQDFRREGVLYPDEPWPYEKLGELWLARGEPERAVARFRQALSLDPPAVGALAGLGQAYMHQSRWEEAIACLLEGLQFQPKSADLHYQLGRAYLGAGERRRASEQFQVAGKLHAKSRAEEAKNLLATLPQPTRSAAATILPK
ncbi:MAG: tetratricopeptide repeat protein [Terriglobia bacterium]